MRSSNGVLATVFAAGLALLAPAAMAADEPWPGIRYDLFGDRPIAEDGVVSLVLPVRAEDAAITPLTVSAAPGVAVKSVVLVIDQNPSPVVATFTFGEAAGDLTLYTRVRVDAYSMARAIVETADGKLHMATRFVKAAGGCSAPAGKDMEAALAEMGRMQMRRFDPLDAAAPTREAQFMLRHPNNSGLQRDQLTGLFVPAMFVNEIHVTRGGKTVFRMDGGISISEDPNIRFTYKAEGEGALDVVARDTEGREFRGSWPIEPMKGS